MPEFGQSCIAENETDLLCKKLSTVQKVLFEVFDQVLQTKDGTASKT